MDYESAVEKIVTRLDPNADEDVLIRWAAALGGFGEETPEYAGIVRSKNPRVRDSWLMRNPLVGFLLVADEEVTRECLKAHRGWCTYVNKKSVGWQRTDAAHFSLNFDVIRKTIASLKAIYLNHSAE